MSKRSIAGWWVAALLLIGGALILVPASFVAWAAHLDSLPRGTTVLPDAYSASMLTLLGIGGALAVGGTIVAIVAWIGAIARTRALGQRGWFNALLWTGIVGLLATPLFGVGTLLAGLVMVGYLAGAPDGVAAAAWPAPRPKAASIRWFYLGLIVMCAGGALAILVGGLGNPGRPLHGQTFTSLALVAACMVLIAFGALAEAVSWWLALFNAHRLADTTWFRVLTWTGVAAVALLPAFGLGALIALGTGIAYYRSAPDAAVGAPATTAGPPSRLVTTT